jgi:fructose 1,6-bisphosphatase
MEYTTLPEVMVKLQTRWQPLNGREKEAVVETAVPFKG